MFLIADIVLSQTKLWNSEKTPTTDLFFTSVRFYRKCYLILKNLKIYACKKFYLSYVFATGTVRMSDSKATQTHNHLVRKRTLNHLVSLPSLAKWLNVRLRTKRLWVRIALLSLKLQVWCLLWARSSLTFRQTIECGFTLKLVRDLIITYSY